jgi:hypothetical protein
MADPYGSMVWFHLCDMVCPDLHKCDNKVAMDGEGKTCISIIQLPLRMTTESSSFFKSRGMWIGFGIAGFFEILAGLHYLFPKVPAVRRCPLILRINQSDIKMWQKCP